MKRPLSASLTVLLPATAALFLAACNPTSVTPGTEEFQMTVSNVQLPPVVEASGPLKVQVEVVIGGCIQDFKRFQVQRTAAQLTLTPIGLRTAGDGPCPANIGWKTVEFTDPGTPARTGPFNVTVAGKAYGPVKILNDQKLSPLEVESVTFPVQLPGGTPLTVEVQAFAGPCHQFSHFETFSEPNRLTLQMMGVSPSSGPACLAPVALKTFTYTEPEGPRPRFSPFEVVVNGKSWGYVQYK